VNVRPALRVLTIAACALWAVAPIRSATPLSEIRVSPDTTVTLGAPTIEDEGVAADNLGGIVTAVSIGSIPADTDLDGYARRTNGDQLLSFDTTVVLPGGATARPGDVVRYNGASYTVEFDAAARGVPGSANVDAVALYGSSLLLSFDVALDLGGVHFEPEDLALFDGTAFSLFFDGAAEGIAPGLDLDAADYLPCNGHLLLSFDGSGAIGGIAFDDDDVLEFDRVATWEMAYDGSAHDPDWDPADLDAVHATVNLGPGPPVPFGQTVTASSKVVFQWPSVVSYRAVRGSFVTSTGIGAYVVNATFQGTGNTITDPAAPTAGTGFWYLVKRGGCTQTSWQSVVGSEPGRDASIP
jgi:hypothetical protein